MAVKVTCEFTRQEHLNQHFAFLVLQNEELEPGVVSREVTASRKPVQAKACARKAVWRVKIVLTTTQELGSGSFFLGMACIIADFLRTPEPGARLWTKLLIPQQRELA